MSYIDILGIDLFKDGASGNGVYINRLSDHLRQSHHHINRPHKHDFYAVIFFTAGSGTHEIEFTAFDVQPGAIFFLAPGQTHNWKLSGDAEGFVLFHNGGFYNSAYAKLQADNYIFYSQRIRESLVLNGGDRKTTIRIFEDIRKEKAAPDIKSDFLILSWLTELYILNERLLAPTMDPAGFDHSYHTRQARFRELLEKNYLEEKSPQRYADWLHLSSKHLNRINKTLLGKTTSEIIADRVILEAKRMLLHTTLNFTEIAAWLGYTDYAYFSKLFRKHTGVSPSQFVGQYSGFPAI